MRHTEKDGNFIGQLYRLLMAGMGRENMKDNDFRSGSVILGIVCILGCLFAVLSALVVTKPFPKDIKLADFTNDTASARLIWPKADPWCSNLILAIPLASPTNCPPKRDCPPFSGTVIVRDRLGQETGRYDISPSTSQQCNWLTPQFDAFIVGWQQTNCLKTALIAGKEYEITVNIPSRPKEFKSLWLGFMQ